MRDFHLYGVRIFDLSTSELTDLLSGWLLSDTPHAIVTPNPEFVLAARRDPSFVELLNRAELSLPDGVGLRFAIPALTGERLSNRHTGVDTLLLLAKLCAEQGRRLVLVGGGPGVAEAAAESMRRQFVGLDVNVVDVGIVRDDRNEIERISYDRTKSVRFEDADVVAVALGMGKQERFIQAMRSSHDQLTNLPINQPRIYIGIGGALDMIAGTRRRAPSIVRRVGLEWLWRLIIEPRRFRRIFNAAIVFPAVVVWDTLRRHRFVAACRATIPEIMRQLRGN